MVGIGFQGIGFPVNGGVSRIINVPFADDFERADGVLGNGWTSPNYLIVSGKAVGTPTVGSELLADPGLEVAYTSGLCGTLALSGSPTMVESADVHGGSKAQQFTGVASNNDAYWSVRPAAVNGQWYLARLWTKKTTLSNDNARVLISQAAAKPATTLHRPINQASYGEIVQIFRTDSTAVITYGVREFGSSAFTTIIFDDGSIKPITYSTLFALRQSGQANLIVRAGMNQTEGICGIVVRADDLSNPQNCIIAYLHRANLYFYIILEKRVNGVWSQLIAPVLIANYSVYVSDKLLEIRCNGSSVSLYYDSVQIGTTQTVADATIINNTINGVMAGGGSSITRFFTDPN